MYSRERSKWVKHLPVIAKWILYVNRQNEPSCCGKKSLKRRSVNFTREQRNMNGGHQALDPSVHGRMPTHEQRHLCMKCATLVKNETHAGKTRDRGPPTSPLIPFPEIPQQQDTRMNSEIGENLGNKSPLPLTWLSQGSGFFVSACNVASFDEECWFYKHVEALAPTARETEQIVKIPWWVEISEEAETWRDRGKFRFGQGERDTSSLT